MSEKELMKVVGFYEGLPIDDPKSFMDEKEQVPVPTSQDLLVKVNAVSVNPVDTKLRQDNGIRNALRILGFDGVGKVVAVGDEVQKFSVGDRVFYAGTTNANRGKKILVINGAGGVGSILNQLAHWAGLEVYATASPKNFEWLKKTGVDYPIDYHQDLSKSFRELGIDQVEYVAVLFDITRYFDQIKHLVRPFGHVGTIVGIKEPLDIGVWKNQSISFDWEYMFAKTDYNYEIETQGEALAHIAALANEGIIRSTLSKVYSDGINAKNLKQATKDVETGHMLGKVVVSGPFNG